ncbi:cystatin-like [Petromyzon marinus]|uniref:Cystatin-like n=1 Tax=Petromyzon marinus TaxID=7757 RepID=A0AAJ7X2I3_PETMA|nr:cystatin-like [Petromyzon marinus]
MPSLARVMLLCFTVAAFVPDLTQQQQGASTQQQDVSVEQQDVSVEQQDVSVEQQDVSVEQQPQLLGGILPIGVDNAEMMMLLDKALAKINAESDGDTWETVDEILAAERQVINGIRYAVKVQLRETKCPKSEALEICETATDTNIGKTSICIVEMVDRPWDPELEVEKMCNLDNMN